ncbi:MAG: response regulator [Ferruginibacter sp.]
MEKTLRILLVDDDADDQVYFIDALKEVNPAIVCEVANNGNEALQQIAIPPPPDLIFMDLNMPIMNGYECLAILKKELRFQHIPVIIFTTSRNPQDIERSKELGASLFFTKPSNFKILCHNLDQIVKLDFPKQQFTL